MELPRHLVFDHSESTEGPSLEILRRFGDTFELSIDDLIDDRIDESWIVLPTLAKSFQAEEGSRFRTSLAAIRWVEKHHGAEPTQSLMRALRIPRSALQDPDRPVRLRLLGTILRAARARGLPESSIFEMGVGAVDIPENVAFRDALATHQSPRQLYERFFAEFIGRFESNYDYKIEKCDSNSMTLRIRPREERIQENGFEVATDRSIAVYRWGVAAGLVKATGRGSAVVTPLRYAGSGSKDELIRLDWNSALQKQSPTSDRKFVPQLVSSEDSL